MDWTGEHNNSSSTQLIFYNYQINFKISNCYNCFVSPINIQKNKIQIQGNKKEPLHPKPRVHPQFSLGNTIYSCFIRNTAWQAAQLGGRCSWCLFGNEGGAGGSAGTKTRNPEVPFAQWLQTWAHPWGSPSLSSTPDPRNKSCSGSKTGFKAISLSQTNHFQGSF